MNMNVGQMGEGQYVRGAIAGVASPPGAHAPTQAHGLVARFFTHPVRVKDGPDKFKFVPVEYLEILLAGDMKAAPVKKVSDGDRHRYAEAYQAFKRGEQIAVTGTPIEQWALLATRPAACQALKMHNIHTVEALSEITDNALGNLHGVSMGQLGFDPRELRTLAKAYVEARAVSEPQEALARENQDLKRRLEAMEKTVADLNGHMAAKAEPGPKSKGAARPKEA